MGQNGAGGGLRQIYRRMSPRRRRHLAAVMALMIAGALFELLTIGAVIPFLALVSGGGDTSSEVVRDIFGAFGVRPGADRLLAATLILVAFATVGAMVRLALAWTSQRFALRLGHDLGVELYARMLRQPYSFHVHRNSSEVIAGIEKVQSVIFSVVLPGIQAFTAAVMALFIVVLLVAIDPATALIALVAMSVVYFLVSVAARTLLRKNSRIIADTYTQRVRQIQEGLGGIRDILLDRSQPVFERNFRRIDRDFREAQATNVFIAAAPRFVVEGAGIVLIALLALYMSYQPGGVVAAIPVLGALALGAQRLLPLIQTVYQGWTSYSGAHHLLFDILALLRHPIVEAGPRLSGTLTRPFERDIVMENVSFRYPGGDAPALSAIDLRIDKGERIGFVGRTGSGKSTLLDLLMGLLEPTEGEIRVDGAGLDSGTLAEWQAQIAHVPQFIYLSDASIASNIAFGVPTDAIDREAVRAAAARARVADFVERLPDGYETLVGERGVRLSGGQRQRIGIARALYKRSGVLIFDEATNALDDETEAAVIVDLAGEGRELTLIIVAHRLSTLAGCDRIVRLEGGRIVATDS